MQKTTQKSNNKGKKEADCQAEEGIVGGLCNLRDLQCYRACSNTSYICCRLHHFPIPNHIKIDVDGHEKEIFLGAKKILKSKKLKSVMVEIYFKNYNEYSLILNIMKKNNFQIKNRSKRIYSNKLIKAQNIYFFK